MMSDLADLNRRIQQARAAQGINPDGSAPEGGIEALKELVGPPPKKLEDESQPLTEHELSQLVSNIREQAQAGSGLHRDGLSEVRAMEKLEELRIRSSEAQKEYARTEPHQLEFDLSDEDIKAIGERKAGYDLLK